LIDMALGKTHGLARGAPLFERNPGSPDLRNRDRLDLDQKIRMREAAHLDGGAGRRRPEILHPDAGRVDATMVEEGIWLGKPANQAQTKIIGSVDGLPGPVIVLAKTVDPAFASAFLAKLLACRTAAPAQPFLGYTRYCRDAVQAFFNRSERAFAVTASQTGDIT
jgi:hypothetical protein